MSSHLANSGNRATTKRLMFVSSVSVTVQCAAAGILLAGALCATGSTAATPPLATANAPMPAADGMNAASTAADLDAAIRDIVRVLDVSVREKFLSEWETIHAAVNEHPQDFQREFQSEYSTFMVQPRQGKYGSMLRTAIAKAEADGVPEVAPIPMRDALGLAAGQVLNDADIVRIFTMFYNPDTNTEAGKKASTRYFAGFYKAAYLAGEFRTAEGKFDKDAAAVHRGGMVKTGENWKMRLEADARLRQQLVQAMTSALVYFEKSGIQYSPEGYRAFITHMASAIADADHSANLEPGAELAAIVYTVAPALPNNVAVFTLRRGDTAIDIAETNSPAFKQAWTDITGLSYNPSQSAKTTNFVVYQLSMIRKIAKIAKGGAEIALLKQKTQQTKQETQQIKQETQQIKQETQQIKQETQQMREISAVMREGTRISKKINALLAKKSADSVDEILGLIKIAQDSNNALIELATKYNDNEAKEIALSDNASLERTRKALQAFSNK